MPEEKINDYVLKLSGKVSLLEELSLGHNYRLTIGGSITEKTDKDNEDGTLNRYYRFEPVQVDIISPLGKTIKSKDPRSKSKLLRARSWGEWKESNSDLGEDEFYEKIMDWIIANFSELANKALK